MKSLFFLCLLFIVGADYAQDSTSISFESPENEYLNLSNDLNGISIIKVSCKDTTLWGKKFFLTYDEYLDGKIIDENDLGIRYYDPEKTTGADTSMNGFDFTQSVIFKPNMKTYDITLAGKQIGDSLDLIIKMPSLTLKKKFFGGKNFFLRRIDCASGDMKIELNKKTPVMFYSDPFIKGGTHNFCILGTENINEWHDKFNLNHFYVFNLKITD